METKQTALKEADKIDRTLYAVIDFMELDPRSPDCLVELDRKYKGVIASDLYQRVERKLKDLRQIIAVRNASIYRHSPTMQAA